MAEAPQIGKIIQPERFGDPWMVVNERGDVVPMANETINMNGNEVRLDEQGRANTFIDDPLVGNAIAMGAAALDIPTEMAAGGVELIEKGVGLYNSALKSFGAEQAGSVRLEETLDAAGEKIRGSRFRNTPLAEFNRMVNPVTSQIGEFVGSSMMPGGTGVQIAAGAAQALGASNDPIQQGLGAALSVGLPAAGAAIGRRTQRAGSGALQRTLGNERTQHRANAVQTLNKAGIVPRRGDAAPPGILGRTARNADIRQDTLAGGTHPDRIKQLDRLSEVTTGPLGKPTSNITPDYMAQVDNDIDDAYDLVRDLVGDVNADDLISEMDFVAERVAAAPTRISKDVLKTHSDMVDAAIEGTMDGKAWQAFRTQLGKLSRSADNVYEQEVLREMIQGLDNVASKQPGAAPAIARANGLWKYRTLVLDKPGVVNDQGWVNSRSMINNLEKAYPNIRRGIAPPEVKQVYDVHVAAQQFPKIADSGTATRVAATQGRGALQTTIDQFKKPAGEQLGASAGRTAAVDIVRDDEAGQ